MCLHFFLPNYVHIILEIILITIIETLEKVPKSSKGLGGANNNVIALCLNKEIDTTPRSVDVCVNLMSRKGPNLILNVMKIVHVPNQDINMYHPLFQHSIAEVFQWLCAVSVITVAHQNNPTWLGSGLSEKLSDNRLIGGYNLELLDLMCIIYHIGKLEKNIKNNALKMDHSLKIFQTYTLMPNYDKRNGMKGHQKPKVESHS